MSARIIGRNKTTHHTGLEYEFWYLTPDFDDLDNYDPETDESGLYLKDVQRDLIVGRVYRFDDQFWIDSSYCPYFRSSVIEHYKIGKTEIRHQFPVGWESMQECIDYLLTAYATGRYIDIAVTVF